MEFKRHYYSFITYLYQGIQAEQQQNMGVRVAYYEVAKNKLDVAVKAAKSLEKPFVSCSHTYTIKRNL